MVFITNMDEVIETVEEIFAEDENIRLQKIRTNSFREEYNKREREQYEKERKEELEKEAMILLRRKTCFGRMKNFYHRNKHTGKFILVSIVSVPVCAISVIGLIVFYPIGTFWYYCTEFVYYKMTGRHYDYNYP